MDAKGSIVFAAIGIVAVAVGIFGFGLLLRNGSTADATGVHLRRIEDGQRDLAARIESISQGIDRSTKTVERVAQRVNEVERTIGDAQSRIESGAVRLGENQQRIATGERILQEVRQRGQSENKKP